MWDFSAEVPAYIMVTTISLKVIFIQSLLKDKPNWTCKSLSKLSKQSWAMHSLVSGCNSWAKWLKVTLSPFSCHFASYSSVWALPFMGFCGRGQHHAWLLTTFWFDSVIMAWAGVWCIWGSPGVISSKEFSWCFLSPPDMQSCASISTSKPSQMSWPWRSRSERRQEAELTLWPWEQKNFFGWGRGLFWGTVRLGLSAGRVR